MLYRHILVATDFSEMGDRAVARAVELARTASARLSLLHVLDATPVPNPLYGHYAVVTDETAERRAIQRAQEELARRIPAESAPLSPVLLTRIGDATDEILGCAAEIGADLVVVATHGRRGVSRLVLGSVAERVVRLAGCSVLVVR